MEETLGQFSAFLKKKILDYVSRDTHQQKANNKHPSPTVVLRQKFSSVMRKKPGLLKNKSCNCCDFFLFLSGFVFFLNTGQSTLRDATIRMEQLKVPHIQTLPNLHFLPSTCVRLCCPRAKTQQGPRNSCPEAEIPDIP